MGRKAKMAPVEHDIVAKVEENNEEMNELMVAKEEVVNTFVEEKKEEPVKEKVNKQAEPKTTKAKRQGVIVEITKTGVIVSDVNGCRFRLTGVKGEIGDSIKF